MMPHVGQPPHAGQVLYDAECSVCQALALRFAPWLERHGFNIQPLQTPGLRERIGLSPETWMEEMRLLTPDGRLFGGTEALWEIARIAMPQLWQLRHVPGIRPLLAWGYREFARRRRCLNGVCRPRH